MHWEVRGVPAQRQDNPLEGADAGTTSDAATGSGINVVARAIGDAPDPAEVLVVAHLDSINHEVAPTAPTSGSTVAPASGDTAAPTSGNTVAPTAAAPGADDNASGSAGVLALATVVAAGHFRNTVTFVLFGGEEQGLLGSRHYVADLDSAARARIVGVINMDMIGCVNSLPRTVLIEGAPVSADLMSMLTDAAAEHTALAVETSMNPYASDHVPFIDAGIPAVLTIEGGDSANDAVHTSRDTADRVDADFAGQILTMNAAVVLELAAPQEES